MRHAFWSRRQIFVLATSAILLSAGLLFEFILGYELLANILFLAVAGVSGYSIARKGVASLVTRKTLDMNFLMTVAAIGAFLIGHGEEGAAVVFLFYGAESLEEYATEKARRSIGDLMKLAPEVATVKRNGEEIEVHVHDVKVDETIVVRPGEKVPLDGIVVEGVSNVNQAPITGESMPVLKQVGSEVYAGTINSEGFLEVRVTKRSDETVLSRIIKLVREAEGKRSPTERFVDKFSRYYTPSVVFLAVLVATVPALLFEMPLSEWVYKALVLLVVSCPCALAISTPVSMVSGITSAARNGVLVKGGRYLEDIGKMRCFAFDKTGTLSEGSPEVSDVIGLSNPETNPLMIAASLEALSEHPIAKAIVERARKDGVDPRGVSSFRSIAGKGVVGEIDGKPYYVGNERLFRELSVDFNRGEMEKLQGEGKTPVLVGDGREVLGIIAVADKIRDVTLETIRDLKAMGIKTVMITGDNERTARTVAKRIGIDEYYAELLPEDKLNMVADLKRKYGRVAMVGDGVNDAPALAQADVGIAMGAIGSDVALETADVALMQDDLSKLAYLVKLGKKTLGVVKQNIAASILIKGSFAVLAFPGVVTLWLAVAVGDMGLSLAVILNALGLSLFR